ncbi:hypothetical protein K466DRAFT_102609 [Polyporus arcularius HHB13444]|uniref:Uncharacterized protein n=1 Tax=Polyporus arcularius HHB13444 TaxID=1314778 RepID=A0A5C3PD79_9APHY|nr:hypothetical protein K466DRAFT_102609 [Polyporus arcularius HHB13444]
MACRRPVTSRTAEEYQTGQDARRGESSRLQQMPERQDDDGIRRLPRMASRLPTSNFQGPRPLEPRAHLSSATAMICVDRQSARVTLPGFAGPWRESLRLLLAAFRQAQLLDVQVALAFDVVSTRPT